MDIANENLKFPDYFPEGCPPDDAQEQELTVYRLCKSKQLTPNDFKSFYLINSDKFKSIVEAYGLSVFLSLQDCMKAIRKSPALRKRCTCYAFGVTYKNTGKIKCTPSKDNPAHYTWWLYEGVQPHTYFTVCNLEVGVNIA